MGYRLYYASTYKVRYDGGYFNYKTEAINRFLIDECGAFATGEEPENASSLEVPRESLCLKIIDMKDNPTKYAEWISANHWDYSVEDLIDIFTEFVNKSEPTDSYIHLEWL